MNEQHLNPTTTPSSFPTRPSSPHLPSASSTTSSSSPSLSSIPVESAMASSSKLPGSAAPLPSPSSAIDDRSQYFAALHPQSQHPLQGQQQPSNPQRQDAHATRQASGNGRSSDSAAYLTDLSLVAEAAKRAQVAIVTRDLEEIQL